MSVVTSVRKEIFKIYFSMNPFLLRKIHVCLQLVKENLKLSKLWLYETCLFLGPGSSSDPCAATYRGPRSFSDVESQNIRDVLLALSNNITGYISMHSFGQAFFHPYSYSGLVPVENRAEQVKKLSHDHI